MRKLLCSVISQRGARRRRQPTVKSFATPSGGQYSRHFDAHCPDHLGAGRQIRRPPFAQEGAQPMRIARPEVPRSCEKTERCGHAAARPQPETQSGRGAPGSYPIRCMRQAQFFHSSNVQRQTIISDSSRRGTPQDSFPSKILTFGFQLLLECELRSECHQVVIR